MAPIITRVNSQLNCSCLMNNNVPKVFQIMFIINSNGLTMLPCGTPEKTGNEDDKPLIDLTFNLLIKLISSSAFIPTSDASQKIVTRCVLKSFAYIQIDDNSGSIKLQGSPIVTEKI